MKLQPEYQFTNQNGGKNMERIGRFICGTLLGAILTLGSLTTLLESAYAKDLLIVCYNDNEWCCEYDYENGVLTTFDCTATG